MGGIEEKGFLSPEICHWTQKIRAENADCFDLCERVSDCAQKTMLSLKSYRYDSCRYDLREVLVAGYMIQALSSFQGVILLSERGMIDEARILLRCLIERMFAIVGISRDASLAQELVWNDLFSKKRAQESSLEDENLSDDEKSRVAEKYKATKDQIKEKGLKEIRIRELAERAGMIRYYYRTAYQMLSHAIHMKPSYIGKKHLEIKDNKIQRLLWGPDVEGIDFVLFTGADVVLRVLPVVSEMFSLENSGGLGSLQKEFDSVYNSWESRFPEEMG